jgi:DivIVA domain-containing protein
MPLTPDDVQSKEFLTVRLREGYDMQEVDQFLDEVEAELRRLYDENDRLRSQLAAAGESGAETGAAVAAAATAAGVTETGLQRAITDAEEAPAAALKILTHAQTTADNLVNDARSQAEAMVADAMAESERLRSESSAEAERVVREATERAEKLRADSEAEAERLLREANERAAALDQETEDKRAEMFGELELAQSKLQSKVDDLRAHEREYRSRLTAYHEAQTRKLRSGELDELEPSTNAIPAAGE